jgi:hypothetical protein
MIKKGGLWWEGLYKKRTTVTSHVQLFPYPFLLIYDYKVKAAGL